MTVGWWGDASQETPARGLVSVIPAMAGFSGIGVVIWPEFPSAAGFCGSAVSRLVGGFVMSSHGGIFRYGRRYSAGIFIRGWILRIKVDPNQRPPYLQTASCSAVGYDG